MAKHFGKGGNIDVDMIAHQRSQRVIAAAKRHLFHFDSGFHGKQFGGDVGNGANTGMAILDGAGFCLGGGDQLFNGLVRRFLGNGNGNGDGDSQCDRLQDVKVVILGGAIDGLQVH